MIFDYTQIDEREEFLCFGLAMNRADEVSLVKSGKHDK